LKPSPPVILDEANPWLAGRDAATAHLTKQNNEVILDKNSSAFVKSKAKLRKQQSHLEGEKSKAAIDAEVEISMDDILQLHSSEKVKEKATSTSEAAAGSDNDDSDGDSEINAQELALEASKSKKKVAAFQQRELVAMAFAGDNVVKVCFQPACLSCLCKVDTIFSRTSRPSNVLRWQRTRPRRSM
jgi:U3 small nucleolar RNA-associated protein 14